VRLAEALRHDLALVDISLGEESGFDVAHSPAERSAIRVDLEDISVAPAGFHE
jgi:hypothetical protein